MQHENTVELQRPTLYTLVVICLLGCFSLTTQVIDRFSGGESKELLRRLDGIDARCAKIEDKLDDSRARQGERDAQQDVAITRLDARLK